MPPRGVAKKPALGKAKAKAKAKAEASKQKVEEEKQDKEEASEEAAAPQASTGENPKKTTEPKEEAPKSKSLSRANLEKLGEMTLQQKIQAAAEATEDPEEQAAILKRSLTAKEAQSVWGKHQSYLKKNPAEKGVGEVSKKEKGLRAAAWLLQTQGKRYLHASRQVAAVETVKKNNTWESEKQMLDRFGWDEFELHQASGRIVWRSDPTTPGVYQYKDTQSYTGDISVGRGNHWHEGMEVEEPDAEAGDRFNQLFFTDAMNLGIDDIAGKGTGKSFGKGKGVEKGKEKGKGRGRGNKRQLALEDGEADPDVGETVPPEEPTEEDLLKEALKKARRGRVQVSSTLSDLEEALGKATEMLSQKGKAAAQGWIHTLGSMLQDLKKVLGGKDGLTSADVKTKLEEVAKVVKGAREETRELMHMANKEGSVVTKKSRK